MEIVKRKIKQALSEKQMPIIALVNGINMTESGYYAMFRNDSVKLDTLKKISDFLNVPMTYFFADDKIASVSGEEQPQWQKRKRKEKKETANLAPDEGKFMRILKKQRKQLEDAQARIDTLIAQNAQLTGIVAK